MAIFSLHLAGIFFHIRGYEFHYNYYKYESSRNYNGSNAFIRVIRFSNRCFVIVIFTSFLQEL